MDAICRAFIGTDTTALTIIVIVRIGILTFLLGEDNCVIRTIDPTTSAGSILDPEAFFLVNDGFLRTPSSCLVFQRIAWLDDVASHWNFIILLIHPIFASSTALSIAVLFNAPTLPG